MVFVAYILFMCCAIPSVLDEVDANSVTTGRYSVLVRGLPSTATEDEVPLTQ